MTHLKGGRTHYTYYRHFDPDFFLCDHYFYILETRGLNEAVPASLGAILVLLCGTVSFHDLGI